MRMLPPGLMASALKWQPMPRLFALVFVVMLTLSASSQTFERELLNSGKGAKSLKIVFLGDGYLESDKKLLRSHAQSAWKRLQSVSPFSENIRGIEVSLLYSYSPRGKKFGTADFRYGSLESSRNRIEVPKIGEAKSDALKAIPDADLIILMTRRAGRSHGGRGVIVLSENGDDSIAHEVGHALGRLADEYQSTRMLDDRKSLPSDRDLTAPNVTLDRYIDPTNDKTIAQTAKWGHFLELPDASPLVSAYQGGYYRTIGVWRPSYLCLMSDSKRASFCPVCHEEMTRKLYDKLGKTFDHKGYHVRYPLKDWK
jgi:IgA peptidase M64